MGCTVERAHPDFTGAGEIFQVLRAHGFALGHAKDLENHRSLMKETVVWNIEKGLALSGDEVARAQVRRGELYHRVRRFMEDYEFLLLPVTQVSPFDIETEWVRAIDGVAMDSYVDWMRSCFYITLTALPAMSIPAGFTPEGLPVGLQIVDATVRNGRSRARPCVRARRECRRPPSAPRGHVVKKGTGRLRTSFLQ